QMLSVFRVGTRLGAFPTVLPLASVPTATQSAGVHHHLERRNLRRFLGIERSNKARANRNTHHNERMFRGMRGRKTVLMDNLPDDVEQRRLDAMTPYQARDEMLAKGINPYKEVSPRNWREHDVTIQSLYAVMDPYVPNEAPTSWTKSGLSFVPLLKTKGEEWKQWGMHKFHNRWSGTKKIARKEGFEKFNTKTFGPLADEIYEQAHNALMARDKKKLAGLITESAHAQMWPDVANGNIVWKLVERVKKSEVVNVRCQDIPEKSGNDIAQITVRMHLKQILAVYDRFGHLILGSETEPRETKEYVVFENHIAVIDGKWRLHEKIYPHWMPKKEPVLRTMKMPEGYTRLKKANALPLRAQELSEKKKKQKNQKKQEEE
ncbi:hypothetical protein PMAYCL1PPCAC_27392, partial [Pristionchus mayeri]